MRATNGMETSETRGNQGRDFTEKGEGERRKKRTQTEGELSEMQGWRGKGEQEWEETITRAAERGHRRTERDNELSCGCCWSQTGSPDDTSVGLTHPDSLISLLKTCMVQQTTVRAKTTHATVGLHDVSGQFQAFIKHQIMTCFIVHCWHDGGPCCNVLNLYWFRAVLECN